MGEQRITFGPEGEHPDIVVRVDDGLDELAAWLSAYFSEAVRSGERFAADQTVQVGWSVLKLSSSSDGALRLLEPDFASMPIQWVEGASRAVRATYVQRAVCDQLGAEPDFASMLQAASVPENLPGPHRFALTRHEPAQRLSGWLVRERLADDAAARLVSLYEISLTNAAITPFLALPFGAVVIRDATEVMVRLGERQITSRSNPFLRRLFGAGGQFA